MNFSEYDLACFLKIPIQTWTEPEESFLSEPESTPGPKCGRKDYVNEKS